MSEDIDFNYLKDLSLFMYLFMCERHFLCPAYLVIHF